MILEKQIIINILKNHTTKLLIFVIFFIFTSAFLFPTKTKTTEITSEKIIAIPNTISGDWDNLQAILKKDLPETAISSDFNSSNSSQPIFVIPVISPDENIIIETPTAESIITSSTQTSTPSQAEETSTSLIIESNQTSSEVIQPLPSNNSSTVPTNNIQDTPLQPVDIPPAPSDAPPPIAPPTTSGETSLIDKIFQQLAQSFSSTIVHAETKDKEDSSTDTFENKEKGDQTKSEKKIEQKEMESSSEILKTFTVSNFIIQDITQKLESDTAISNTNLALSFAGWPDKKRNIKFEYRQKDEWKQLHTIKINTEKSNNSHGGYYLIPLDFITKVSELAQLQIMVTYNSGVASAEENSFLLDAIWIEAQTIAPVPIATTTPRISMISEKHDFESDENVLMVFHFDQPDQNPQPGIVQQIKDFITKDPKEIIDISKNTEVTIKDENGEVVDSLEPKITYLDNNNFTINIDKKQQSLKPGNYQMTINIYSSTEVLNYQKDFTWGVLTVNTNKDKFSPGEQVYLQIASLDSKGHTLCNSKLQLTITDPSGAKSTPTILISADCGPNTVTSKPDYYAYYTPTISGTFTTNLKNLDSGYEISDFFQVTTNIPFIIERIGPTRIYPLAEYGFNISINPQNDFEGSITETVPKGFVLKSITVTNMWSGTTVSTTENSHTIDINANVKWKKGEIQNFSYIFDAPDVSPELFLLGPLTLTASTTTNTDTSTKQFSDTYSEARQWHIASDDFAIINPNGDGTIGCTATPSSTPTFGTIADATTQPTTPNTTNYITCALNNSNSYDFETATNVGNVSQIQFWVYYQSNTTNDTLDIELWNNTEDIQYGSTRQLVSQISSGWASTTFSGLSLTQSQLDNLRIKYKSTGTGGTGSNLYATYGVVTFSPANPPPEISNIQLNGGSDIILTANTTTPVTTTAIISDLAGYADIKNVTAKIFRSEVFNTEACTLNDNNCYTNSNCTLSNCSENTCLATCAINMQFFADPTDPNTPWASQYWRAWIQATDNLDQSGSAYSPINTPEVQSLTGISLQGANLSFGTLAPGQSTSPLTASTSIMSVGNTSIDIVLYGTDMINTLRPSSTISVSQLRFSNTTNTPYASSTPLAYSPGVEIDLNIPKPTSQTLSVSSTIWWGLEAPVPSAGSYAGDIMYTSIFNPLPWP